VVGSRLIGRTRELALLRASTDEGARLVTLWGPGGVGKTTIARAHLESIAEEDHAVAWVDLASARTRRDVLFAMGAAIGLSPTDAEETLALLELSEGLLVLDNLEQLDDGARAAVAELARRGRRLAFVITSREALSVEGERVIEVSGLDEAEAIALLRARAEVSVTRADARAIAARLEGIPLAIELAAARLPVLGAHALLSALDRPLGVLSRSPRDGGATRHASLRHAIAWSWELLDEVERRVVGACSVFESTFPAGRACALSMESESDTLDALERARRCALVRRVELDGVVGLSLPGAIRDFARERLDESGELRRARDAHARVITEEAAAYVDALDRGAAAPRAFVELTGDLVAIAASPSTSPVALTHAALALSALSPATSPREIARHAIERALASQRASEASDPVLVARLSCALARHARAEGRLTDARASLADAHSALELCGSMCIHGDRVARVRVDVARVDSAVARGLGDLDVAREQATRSLAAARELGDEARIGLAVGELGAVHQSAGRLREARAHHAEAVSWLSSAGSLVEEARERSHLAVVTHRSGDPRAAVALHESALAAHRALGQARLVGAEHLHLAYVFHELGEVDRARASFSEARDELATCGARGLEALAYALEARLHVDEGELGEATLRLGDAKRATPDGWARIRATTSLVEGHLAMAEGRPAAAVLAYEASFEASRDVEVGFEALTPAYAALAHARGGDAGRVDALLSLATTRVGAFENPHSSVALEVLASAARGAAYVEPPPEARAASSDVRRALAFAGEATSLELRVHVASRTVTRADGSVIDLSRRKSMWGVFLALCRARVASPGAPVPIEALVAAGWPREKMRNDAATKRLHTAIWSLRRAGIEAMIVTSDEGYALDPSIALELDGPHV
jgi:predicted ATPase